MHILGLCCGLNINAANFQTFKNHKGETIPCSWMTAWKIINVDDYCPRINKSQVLLNFFNEPNYIKGGVVRLGTEHVKDANNDNN